MMELLSPAGGFDSLIAAVQTGADAVYMGFGAFNARRSAKNFTDEEFASAVSYCHLRGVRVFLTLNTLLTDRELVQAADALKKACAMGVDAILVQDWGLLTLAREIVPDVPLHASTQMSLFTLGGANEAAALGMERVVLARELNRDEVREICAGCPAEIEIFIHGALCMCYSGQCEMSAVVGERSGNRGACAQPCRLPYGVDGPCRGGHPLSLKDANLSAYLGEMAEMGVACLKLEGRMKRPEYVAVVTGIYARALREGREPTAEELAELEAAFSRQGFTEGYYLDQKGPGMFGVREDAREPRELYARARTQYQSGERQSVPITFYAMIRKGEPAQVAVQDPEERVITAEGPVPEAARTKELTAADVEAQLSRTGGTPFRCAKVRALVEPGLSLPVSVLNSLRRGLLDSLRASRSVPMSWETGEFHPGVRYENRREAPILNLSLRTAGQLTDALLDLGPGIVYLPAAEAAAHPEAVKRVLDHGVRAGVTLPRICWDRERQELYRDLEAARASGCTEALAGTLDLLRPARDTDYNLRGDFGLEIYNAQALKEYKRLGLQSATLSFELKLAQIRDLSKGLDTELVVYGRLPLMITENCIIHNHSGRHTCANVNLLTDRKGERFPVVKAPGCRNEILNSKKLFLADKAGDWQRLGLWAGRLMFTTENARECVQVLERYLGRGSYQPNDYTRGLYYRGVE